MSVGSLVIRALHILLRRMLNFELLELFLEVCHQRLKIADLQCIAHLQCIDIRIDVVEILSNLINYLLSSDNLLLDLTVL